MRSILLTILLAISSTIAFAQDIVILGEENEAEISAHAIKVVKYRDNFRFHCTYTDVLAYLKEQAVDNDANLVKITKQKLLFLNITMERPTLSINVYLKSLMIANS